MMRIILFLLTNLSVIFVFGIVLNLINIDKNNIQALMIISCLFGFCGSLVSLILSKRISLKTVNGKIIKTPHNKTEEWLTDTIVNQAKKVNIKTPQISIYSSLDINAFATGTHRNSSLIAISSGLLKNMTKDEAEAVIAHEISHISNGDMITMTMLQGVINTFVIFISKFFSQFISKIITNNNDENENHNNNQIIYNIITIILEIIFGVIATIITMWYSRYREYHADANSAKLVGYKKMITALKKLKTNCEPYEENILKTFYINGKTKGLNYLFLSHPPLNLRIKALISKKF
ncbi:Protease HtpX [Candidatus Providencia siddallii]|uniref:Protease HtpX n=1 Tax=Candidatus Providencia siddallii TaxID=1715285 RepID=A0A0M6W8W7_9GAMM|nr:Protease HtpX [Candidatus Providencia siddallii]